MNYRRLLITSLVAVALLATGQVFAQETKKEKINFVYSKNPPIRTAKVKPSIKTGKPVKGKNSSKNSTGKVNNQSKVGKLPDQRGNSELNTVADPKAEADKYNNSTAKTPENTPGEDNLKADEENRGALLTLAQKTREIAKTSTNRNLSPMEFYKVGTDDVLFISLLNANSNPANYYTVLNDGTIDYPLAGAMVTVAGLTTDEIEDLLREKIKLYENPDVSVQVREHASHRIMVSGLVEKAGEKFLQREAIPLFVIRAEAMAKPEADQVTVKRTGNETQTFSLKTDEYQSFLVFPGDIVEFGDSIASSGSVDANSFIYIGSFVKEDGKRNYIEGITLTQAILASGGLRNSKIKKIVVRSKNEDGLLETKFYNLRDIRKGKSPDPILRPGDMIEKDN